MSSHLEVQQAVELLNRLQSIVRDVVLREAKLDQDQQTRESAARQSFEQTAQESNGRCTVAVAQADAAFRSRQEKVRSTLERRRAWIAKARNNCNRQVLENINAREGREKYDWQKGNLDAERNRMERLAANEQALGAFQQQLAESHAVSAGLEQTAQKHFRGYRKFRRWLIEPPGKEAPDLSRDEHQLFEDLQELHGQTGAGLKRFRRFLVPLFFSLLPPWLLAVLLLGLHAALPPVLKYLEKGPLTYPQAAMSLAGLLVLLIAAYVLGGRKAGLLASTIAVAIDKARSLHEACQRKAEERYHREIERIEAEFVATKERLAHNWENAVNEAAALRESWPVKVAEKAELAQQHNQRWQQQKAGQLERAHTVEVERLKQATQACLQQAADHRDALLAKIAGEYDGRWQALEAEWKDKVNPIFAAFDSAVAAAKGHLAEWTPELLENWTPSTEFPRAIPFGSLQVDLTKLCEVLPKTNHLVFPGPATFTIPLMLQYPSQGSILFETGKTGAEDAAGALNNIMLRLLVQSPPGRLSFTIVDPVKLGENFAGIMHLSDYAEHLINSRIWTQASQIEQRLADLNEHMEKVIQIYLRNEYATIAEYNEQAGNIAEKYHFLVIADFPVNFSEIAIKRLLNIAASGARCGVYTLIHWDQRRGLPPDLVPADLRKSNVCVTHPAKHFNLPGLPLHGVRLLLNRPPQPDYASDLLHKIGQASIDSNRVEVPFAHVIPPESEIWTGDTADELKVPIGRTGATKLQYLAIGKGTRQHALLAGKTGSGKSTLFHVMVTSLSLWFSPEQVEFYLVDFKKGVEFKCYASNRLPHARVVAIESDREFGLSVLQRIDAELRRRGDIYRQLGVQDLAGYKRAGGTEPMPRSLLIIDVFQEFFVEDDQVSQNAAVLLDRIVRQGRAFGIHVLLGSQTLGGAYTLARTTIGQMVIRIALQCNEADAYLIMDDSNPAPRLLSRPGEGIYNDAAGSVEGNSPFQVVWLPDQERDAWLKRVRAKVGAKAAKYPGPIVFEGNVPADIRENALLERSLQAEQIEPAPLARAWLGAPVSIKGPTEAVFQKQSGYNLLVVGQREEAMLATLSINLVALAAQFPLGAARFVLIDASPSGLPTREFLDRIVQAIPHPIVQAKTAEVGDTINELATELKSRSEAEHSGESQPIFVIIHEIQNFKKLRREDDFSFSLEGSEGAANPATQLNELICEGPSHGLHVIVTCDTYNNVNRFISRKALSEFEMRVLFQMSANDSASLCDSPKASLLGLYRALFYNEHEGYLEMFRPYALPDNAWIESAAADLARLLK